MNYKFVSIIVIVSIVCAGAVGFMAADTLGDSPENNSRNNNIDESSPPPRIVNESREGAQKLKLELMEHPQYDNATVGISPNSGEVIVIYQSDARNGAQLKSEMEGIAMIYSEVVSEHPNTGGLVVRSNGIELLVSKYTAIEHGNGEIKEEAYKKTFVYRQDSDNNDKGN